MSTNAAPQNARVPQLSEEQIQTLIQRIKEHLERESELIGLMDQVNQQTCDLLSEAGLRMPELSQFDGVQSLSDELRTMNSEMGLARTELLAELSEAAGVQVQSIRDFIHLLPLQHRNQLAELRQNAFSKTAHAHSTMHGTQAVLYYMFDYHKRYLNGISSCSSEPPSYRANGQTQELNPGHILRKTC